MNSKSNFFDEINSSGIFKKLLPTVVNDDFLLKSLQDNNKSFGNDLHFEEDEEEDERYSEIYNLNLEYSNIFLLTSFVFFKNLTSLKLNNNHIHRITSINNLCNLVSLDLSFNKIKKIENLERLKSLNELLISNNLISNIENLSQLENLKIFSIADNFISDEKEVWNLRTLKNLRTLVLQGNPCCSQVDNYESSVASLLQGLMYLDYKRLDRTKKGLEDACPQHITQITLPETNKLFMKENQVKLAFMESIGSLWDKVEDEDDAGELLKKVDFSLLQLMEDHKTKFTKVCDDMVKLALVKFGERKKYFFEFSEFLIMAKQQNDAVAVAMIEEFENYKKRVWDAVESSETTEVEKVMIQFDENVASLWWKLMDNEMQLCEQLQDGRQQYEFDLQENIKAVKDWLRDTIQHLETLEQERYGKYLKILMDLNDKVSQGVIQTDQFLSEITMTLADKEALKNLLKGSLECRLHVLMAVEDSVNNEAEKWLKREIEQIRLKEEVLRSRDRVVEINHYVDHKRNLAEEVEVKVYDD